MAGAFEKPIFKSDDGYERKSIKALLNYAKKIYDNYVDEPKRSWCVCLDDMDLKTDNMKVERATMKNLAEVVVDAVKDNN